MIKDDCNSNKILPPKPPLDEDTNKNKIIPGEFNYITDNHYKIMLVTAWKAINTLELWDFIKINTESFAFSTDPRLFYIYKQIENLGYNGHSGMSFGITMRDMQFIAKNGEEEFRKTILKN